MYVQVTKTQTRARATYSMT